MTKQEAYEKGFYSFPVPPVCTAYWDDESWIKFIDAQGDWLVEISKGSAESKTDQELVTPERIERSRRL